MGAVPLNSRIQAYFFCNAPQKSKLSEVAPCCICAPQSHRLKIRCPTRVPNMANWTACARRRVGNEAGGPAANQCKTMCSTWPTKSKWTHLYGFGRFPLQISDTCFLLIWFRNRNMKKNTMAGWLEQFSKWYLKDYELKAIDMVLPPSEILIKFVHVILQILRTPTIPHLVTATYITRTKRLRSSHEHLCGASAVNWPIAAIPHFFRRTHFPS